MPSLKWKLEEKRKKKKIDRMNLGKTDFVENWSDFHLANGGENKCEKKKIYN